MIGLGNVLLNLVKFQGIHLLVTTLASLCNLGLQRGVQLTHCYGSRTYAQCAPSIYIYSHTWKTKLQAIYISRSFYFLVGCQLTDVSLMPAKGYKAIFLVALF